MSDDATPRHDSPPAAAAPKAGMSTGVKVLLGCGLMVPVFLVCGGITAATAIPAFMRFTLGSKAAEAPVQLDHLAGRVRAACHDGVAVPSAGPLPETPGPERQVTDFTRDPGFAALGFAPSEPLYFSYAVVAAPGGPTLLMAEGDLDGDGTRSRYRVECSAACECGALSVEREFE